MIMSSSSSWTSKRFFDLRSTINHLEGTWQKSLRHLFTFENPAWGGSSYPINTCCWCFLCDRDKPKSKTAQKRPLWCWERNSNCFLVAQSMNILGGLRLFLCSSEKSTIKSFFFNYRFAWHLHWIKYQTLWMKYENIKIALQACNNRPKSPKIKVVARW